MYYVIGSGPTGTLSAHALLAQGASVTMLDAGVECDADTASIVEQLNRQNPAEWAPNVVEKIKGEYPISKAGPPMRMAYGSWFPYAFQEIDALFQKGTDCCISHAQGGLSNVWGGAMMPNRQEDFEQWPITLQNLEPHYSAVADVVKIAAGKDDLERLFPFYAPTLPAPQMSQQARTLVDHMQRNKSVLNAHGIHFGQSRLAMRTMDSVYGKGCNGCGLCLSGCPYHAIYNTSETLREMRGNPKFRYLKGLMVKEIHESKPGGVQIKCHTIPDAETLTFEGSRAFIAAGIISTAKIVLQSLMASGQNCIENLKICYHPYFLFPLLMFKNTPNVTAEKIHTLTQLYIEIFDEKVARYPVHLQISTYNEIVRDKLRHELRYFKPLTGCIEKVLLGRIIAAQGYLHSKEASPIVVRSFVDPTTQNVRLELRGEMSPHVRGAMKRVCRKLLTNSLRLGAMPLSFIVYPGKPGIGNHCAGIFPMRKTPKDFETDVLGQLNRLQRVHMVDASVLNDIPAPTITYTAMANAHRIATRVAEMDKAMGDFK